MPGFLQSLKQRYLAATRYLDKGQSVLLLLLRLYFGLGFVQAGWGKLSNIAAATDYFAGLHIPLPTLNAYLAGLTECVCGLLLVLGVASRLVAIPLIFVMLVAYLTAHRYELESLWMIECNGSYNPHLFFKAPAFLSLLTALLVLLFGPGVFSIDGLLKWYFDKKGGQAGTGAAGPGAAAPAPPAPGQPS